METDSPFTLMAQREDGRTYLFNRGTSTPQTLYESASTSKLVSALIILRQVDRGVLRLEDHPQDHIPNWALANDPTLSGITLAQLLSFTSGLEQEPLCINRAGADFRTCVLNIGASNADNGTRPGTAFYYSATHLQVAGLMAMNARGVGSWQSLFAEFQSETGLFPNGSFDVPSLLNPRLAGGMRWTASDYLAFLDAFRSGELLSRELQVETLRDQIGSAELRVSPVLTGLGEAWHFGFGFWHECPSPQFSCAPAIRISSPGAFGSYPFWDRTNQLIGIIARQGPLNTYTQGIRIEREVRSLLDEWSACE